MTFNYIGSKKSLLDFINIPVNKIVKKNKKDDITFLDAFAGTGIVGSHFHSKYNFHIISNDMEYYSYIINYSLHCVPFTDQLEIIINQLNTDPITYNDDYKLIATTYSPKGEIKRMFWTIENAEKADSIMYSINTMHTNGVINNDIKIFLIASLLSSMDKVANTTSVYGAFLKAFKKSAQNKMNLVPIHINRNIIKLYNTVYCMDVNSDEIMNKEYDIAYLDPPYNQRQYSSNYHPLNFIAKYDLKMKVYGKTGLIENYNKSNYCNSKNVITSFTNLITTLKAKHILLSYNNEGLMDSNTIVSILKTRGNVTLYKKLYKKYKSQETQENENVYELLYHLEISNSKKYKEIILE